MKDTGLLKCPRTGKSRTLYSLRHTYATFALLNDGMDVHTLAVQMGTSIPMIERHYSHLTPRLRKDMLTGKRYEMSKDEYRKQYDVTSHAMARSDIDRPAADVGAVEEDLPVDPIEIDAHSSAIVDDAVAAPVVAPEEVPKRAVEVPTAAERAFDLFDAGKLSEAALLAALGVSRDGYVPVEALAHRALNALEAGALSEAGLIKVLGS